MIDVHEIRWLFDDIKECMPCEETLRGSRDYDDWMNDEDGEEHEDVSDLNSEGGGEKEVSGNVMSTDAHNDLKDPCRVLMMNGEGDEQYHSDDDSFVIGGTGDQKKIDD